MTKAKPHWKRSHRCQCGETFKGNGFFHHKVACDDTRLARALHNAVKRQRVILPGPINDAEIARVLQLSLRVCVALSRDTSPRRRGAKRS